MTSLFTTKSGVISCTKSSEDLPKNRYVVTDNGIVSYNKNYDIIYNSPLNYIRDDIEPTISPVIEDPLLWATYNSDYQQALVIRRKVVKSTQKKQKWYQRLFKKNRISIQHSRWERDLTRECVESNPGPMPFGLPNANQYKNFTSSLFASWNKLGQDHIELTNTIEALLIVIYQLMKADSKTEKVVAIVNFSKHIDTKNSILFGTNAQRLIEHAERLFTFTLQSDSNVTIKDLLEHYEQVRDSDLVKKLHSFSMFALSLSLFDKLGLSMDNLQYTKMEQEAIKKKYYLGPNFIYTILDTCVYIVEQGQQFLRTGNFSDILHSGSQYGDWFELTYKLKMQEQFISNPEPHGFTQFSYHAELSDAIDRGQSIVEHAKCSGNKIMIEKTRGILNALKFQKANLISKKSSSQSREAPFAILISGGSSVGKSSFTRILAYHFAEIMGLPHGDEYIHTRNYMDDYFVNFNSSQHTILIDDIALFNPSKAPNGDPSLAEVIQIINSVSFNPPQAALEDKGKTPMLAKLVIATTNTPDLNAHCYFSCPLAVRRRLPYIVDISPKREYAKDTHMLDGSKVPIVPEGEYADFWNISVRRVVPDPQNEGTEKQGAKDELVFSTDDIYTFLDWYTKTAMKFRDIQRKETACKDKLDSIKVCKICYKIQKQCHCSSVEQQSLTENFNARVKMFLEKRSALRRNLGLDRVEPLETQITYAQKFQLLILYLFYRCSVFKIFVLYICGYQYIFNLICKTATPTMAYHIYRQYGDSARRRIGMSDKFKYIKYAMVTITSSILLSALVKMFMKTKASSQSNFTGSGSVPQPSEKERDNVWYKDDYQMTTFDVPLSSASYIGQSFDELAKKLGNNMIYVKIKNIVGNTWQTSESCGFCIGGHNYIFNNHSFPKIVDKCTMRIIDNYQEGVNGTIETTLFEENLTRNVDRDFVHINITNLPPKKDITNLFAKDSLKGNHKGYYILKNEFGNVELLKVDNIVKNMMNIQGEFHGRMNLWVGHPETVTKYGHCGGLLLSDSSFGPIILGFHAMKDERNDTSLAIPLYDEDVLEMKLKNPIVSCNKPALDAQNVTTTIVKLHNKSVFRYIEKGSANVYGSFNGFKPKMKSNVKLSHIAKNLMQRGWQLKHGAPVMSGWTPWRIAALDMVKPVTQINESLLKRCAENFKKDIFTKICKHELSQVCVLDDITTLNGANGVSYIDKINRNTSAGFPWRKSKKHFMYLDPTEEMPDAIGITKDIQDRVLDCISKYERCERYMPVFTGHLKDEATSFKKIKMAKTRVFTGAPLDYTIVVRKYLLSVIRLMQNNRFIFECGPGTIAQSLEWQQIGQFITRFGKDRMIAGDYKAFDKSMPPCVILAAFDIIYDICKEAGYTEKELNVVRSISEDTAYPLVDFNGDLVQFYGSNPSGHPLTVIINGLANSLYLRYVYASLSPDKSAEKFQDHVAVMTYGDDNVMGVSNDIDFFNHTTIQNVLKDVGIIYTMADKEAASVPFLHLSEVSFLKRTWRYDNEIGAVVAPLEVDSIEKMVLIGVASKTITPEAQSIATINSAIREYFWHGRDVFEEKRAIFLDIIHEEDLQAYMCNNPFPTWDDLRTEFWKSSKHVTL